MVYSVCSTEPEEGEEGSESFCWTIAIQRDRGHSRFPEAFPDGCGGPPLYRMFPHLHGWTGSSPRAYKGEITPAVSKLLKIPLYLLILFAVGACGGPPDLQGPDLSKSVVVPDVQGKSMIEANTILKNEGLYIRVEGEDYDPAVPEGFIVRQDIPSGNKVKEGREIKVIVSKGPRISMC